MMVEGTKILTTWTWEDQTFGPHGYDTAGQGRHVGHRAPRRAIREGEPCPITADFAVYQRSRDGAEVADHVRSSDPMAIKNVEMRWRGCCEA